MTERALVPHQAGSVPPIIQAAIKRLFACVPSSANMVVEDRAALMRGYAEAAGRVPVEFALQALEKLIFSNPRNPFMPSVHDIAEACDRAYRKSLTDEQMAALVAKRVAEKRGTKAFGTHDSGP